MGPTGLPRGNRDSTLNIDEDQSQVLVSGRPVKVYWIYLDDQRGVQSIRPTGGQKFLILGKEAVLEWATLRADSSLHRVRFAIEFRMELQGTELVIREAELSPDQDRFLDIELDGRFVSQWKVGWYRTFWGGRKFGRFTYTMLSLQFSPQGEFLSGRLEGRLKWFEYEAAPGVEVDPDANYPCLEFNESGQITGFNRPSCDHNVDPKN